MRSAIRNSEVPPEALFKALGDPQRVQILRLVRDRELPSGAIAGHFRTTPQAVSQQLRILSQARLLELRREGTRRLYRASREALAPLRNFLDSFHDEAPVAPSVVPVWRPTATPMPASFEADRRPPEPLQGGEVLPPEEEDWSEVERVVTAIRRILYQRPDAARAPGDRDERRPVRRDGASPGEADPPVTLIYDAFCWPAETPGADDGWRTIESSPG